MKERLNSESIKSMFEQKVADDVKNLDKIRQTDNLNYFHDEDIVGYPWWSSWKQKEESLEGEIEEKGNKYRNRDNKEEIRNQDYEEYADAIRKLETLHRDIDADVEKYKSEYEKELKDSLEESILDLRETVAYNMEAIDYEIVTKRAKIEPLQQTINKKSEEIKNYKSYKGTESKEYSLAEESLKKLYKELNKLLREINELEQEKRVLLAIEEELKITELEDKIGRRVKSKK